MILILGAMHDLNMGAAAETASVGLGDLLTKMFTEWKFPTFGGILGLDLRAKGFHTFYGQSHHFVLT